MSISQKNNISKGLIGHKLSDLTKSKISRTKRGYKPVLCSNGVIFYSAAFAVDWLKKQGFLSAQQTHIRKCCEGKSKTAYGYTWKYQDENS